MAEYQTISIEAVMAIAVADASPTGATTANGVHGQEELGQNGINKDIHNVLDQPLSKPPLLLEDTTVDDVRPLRVAVIGAGLSGVLAGILLPAKVPKIELTIFEKNTEVVSTTDMTISVCFGVGVLTIGHFVSAGRNMVGEHISWCSL